MGMHSLDGDIRIDTGTLARLMPMHLILSAKGVILGCGPTLQRLFPDRVLVGQDVLAVFDLRGPGQARGLAALTGPVGQKLRVLPQDGADGLRLRGVALPLGRGAGPGWLVNLSFGIDIIRAVGALHLTDADFAPTDVTMELLYLSEANAAVTGELRAMSQRLEDARFQAKEEALTDTLTGLRNRRACDSVLARLCREEAPFALMHLDLDYFKAVNDSLGHAAGDHVLCHASAVLRSHCRANDCLARVGGDEFVMIFPHLTEAENLTAIGERIIASLQVPIPFQDQECRISGSIGFVTVPAGVTANPAAVLADADTALYAAKAAGRACVRQGTLDMGALDMGAAPPGT